MLGPDEQLILSQACISTHSHLNIHRVPTGSMEIHVYQILALLDSCAIITSAHA